MGQDLGFGFQGEWKGYQSSPRKYTWGGGGGGGKAGLRLGLEGFWIWFLVGTAGRGTSCRQGTLVRTDVTNIRSFFLKLTSRVVRISPLNTPHA